MMWVLILTFSAFGVHAAPSVAMHEFGTKAACEAALAAAQELRSFSGPRGVCVPKGEASGPEEVPRR